jgi:hypothetical protein
MSSSHRNLQSSYLNAHVALTSPDCLSAFGVTIALQTESVRKGCVQKKSGRRKSAKASHLTRGLYLSELLSRPV